MDDTDSNLPLVEIGWLIAGRLDDVDLRAIQRARQQLTGRLTDAFGQFRWRMPLVRWEELPLSPRTEPAELLEHGLAERNAKHWDFTIIVTATELIGHYRAECSAALSRSLDSALISTAQLDPRSTDPDAASEQRTGVIAKRLERLVLYLFGRLCGLERDMETRDNALYCPAELSEMDLPGEFSPGQLQALAGELEEIADRRLEETSTYRAVRPWRFYLVSSWVNRRDILHSVREARPWQFPFWLSRLTTAALSAMLVLMITAEVWELAIRQHGALVALLSVASVCLATGYILLRQGLYVRRGRSRLTEQTVTTNVTMVMVVLLGMITTYLLVFAIAGLAGMVLFQPRLVAEWSGHVGQPPWWDEYLLLAGLVAALAIGIGALGASYESSHYFRHITFVDEEI